MSMDGNPAIDSLDRVWVLNGRLVIQLAEMSERLAEAEADIAYAWDAAITAAENDSRIGPGNADHMRAANPYLKAIR